MNRSEMVKTRTEELSKLSDRELVCAIVEYFKQNATMPGEKNIKDTAAMLFAEMEEKQDFALLKEFRKELIEEFASLCVKQIKLRKVKIPNKTKKNEQDMSPENLSMVLKDSQYRESTNSIKDIYEMDAIISGADNIVVESTDGRIILAGMPEKFHKNHPDTYDKKASVLATDHSNGKLANMSYMLLIDLAPQVAV